VSTHFTGVDINDVALKVQPMPQTTEGSVGIVGFAAAAPVKNGELCLRFGKPHCFAQAADEVGWSQLPVGYESHAYTFLEMRLAVSSSIGIV
jgi:hypothetical protein